MQRAIGGYRGDSSIDSHSRLTPLPASDAGAAPAKVPTPSLRVEPARGDFNDVERSTKYVLPFTIHNTSSKMKRLRFGRPKSSCFKLSRIPTSIAPGLAQVVEVEFQTDFERDVNDQWVLMTDDGQITIPLSAWFPCPNVLFDTVLSLGSTMLQHNVSRVLSMKNIGKRAGRFKFMYDLFRGLSITPKEGIIRPNETVDVRVDYFGSDKGLFECRVDVDIDGTVRRLDVSCAVTDTKVSVWGDATDPGHPGAPPDGSYAIIDFGTCYFGQSRTKTLKVTNESPFVVSWHIHQPEVPDAPMEDAAADEALPITFKPAEGRLGAFGSTTVEFDFRPIFQERRKGFTRTAKKAAELSTVWKNTYVVEILETEQKLELGLMGKALQPDVSFSETVFRFGECEVNDHRDIIFTIMNNSAELPVDWAINRIAHFHATPSKGFLNPGKPTTIRLTFLPNQMGNFTNTLTCTLAGIKQMPLAVQGHAASVGTRRQLVGGPDRVAADFQALPKAPQPGEAVGRRRPKKQMADSLATDKLLTSADRSAASQAKYGTGLLAWEEEMGLTPEEALMVEYQQKRAHNKLYNDFVENSKTTTKLLKKLHSGEMDNFRAVDLGMTPGDGLVAPEPRMPRIEDPLWLERGGHAQAKDDPHQMRPVRRHKFEEMKVIKKKFKETPSTLNEQRECKMMLSPKELLGVVFGPKVLDFGKVTVGSTNVKSFFVCNDLKTFVMITVPLNIREELKQSFPASQVVPPGATAGFDITFCSKAVQTFQQAIYFSLNEHHKLKFVVFAEVVQVDLSLSQEEMVFRFNDYTLEPTVTQSITISNNGNAEAFYVWEREEDEGEASSPVEPLPFRLHPMSGVVPADGAVQADVIYDPGAHNESRMAMVLKVDNGPSRRLLCSGTVAEAKCVVLEKKVDFGALAGGCLKRKLITVKNSGSTAAVFHIAPLVPGFSCDPMRGRVVSGGSQEVQVTFSPTESVLYQTTMLVHILGGKQLKVPLRGEGRMASATLEVENQEEEVNFEDTFVGGLAFRRMQIHNLSQVPAIVLVDLSHNADFALADEDRGPVLQVVEGAVEDVAGPSGVALISTEESDDESSLDNASRVGVDERDSDVDRRREGDTGLGNGPRYRLSIPTDQSVTFHLVFQPSVVATHAFPLNVRLAGNHHMEKSLERMVTAKALKPRLVLSQTLVDFHGKVVIRDGTVKIPNRILLKLTNEDDKPLEWLLLMDSESVHREIFRLDPHQGKLLPGHSVQVQVSFSPTAVRAYSMTVPVYLDGSLDTKYTELTLRGTGTQPALLFDRPEVMLPTVPLEIKAKAVLYLTNGGYELLEVKYKVPLADLSKVPLSVAFPEGNELTQSRSCIPVEVSFVAKKPIVFTTTLEFFDEEGNRFAIPVSGCADNSLLTCFPYLAPPKHRDLVWEAEAENRPVMLLEPPEEVTKDDGDNFSDISAVERHVFSASSAQSLNEDGVISQYERQFRRLYSRKHVERLRLWLNNTILHEPIDDLITGLPANYGRPFYEFVETVYGKSPPGKLNPAKLSHNKRDSALAIQKQYDDLLTWLRGLGALLIGVRPEFLMRYDEYCRMDTDDRRGTLVSTANAPSTASSLPTVRLGTTTKPRRMTERRFLIRAAHAWMSVLFQVIRLFLIAKITWKSFVQQPMSPVMKAVAEAEGWAKLKVDPSTANSNVFSVGEALILKWLTIHKQAAYPVGQEELADRLGAVASGSRQQLRGPPSIADSRNETPINSRQPSASPTSTARLMSFGSGLHDGKAFAAVLKAYVPSLVRRFDPSLDHGFLLQPKTGQDYERNLAIVLNAMREAGMHLPLTAREMLDFSHLSMLLFSWYLYTTLPGYLPKAVVKFKGSLHQEITKTIELKNPSKTPLDYDAFLWGGDDFRMRETHVTIPAGGVVQFTVSIVPRFRKSPTARLTFLTRRKCGPTMVFALETDLTYEGSAQVVELETPVYEVVNHDLKVTNMLRGNAQFTLHLSQERLKGEKEEKCAEEASAHLFPDPFWTASDTVTIKKDDTVTVGVQFVPFIRGQYRCLLVFTDEKVGELAVLFRAKANLPLPAEKTVVQSEANTPTTKEVLLPFRNAGFERALNAVSDRFKQFKSRDRKGNPLATAMDEVMRYNIHYSSPFYSGPKVLEQAGVADTKDEDKKDKEKKARKEVHTISVDFKPKAAGTYPAKIILSSSFDVRVVEVEGRARSPGMKAELDFACPARQQITQDIPITNRTEKDWIITSVLTGDHFSALREFRVPAGKTKNYQLVFAPPWICNVQGSLTLKNNESLEKYFYTLHGRGEEPLAENHVQIECRAREQVKVKLNIPNICPDDVEYTVESDLNFLSGNPRVAVPRMETTKYEITLAPILAGRFSGTVTFTAPNRHYLWYVITVTVHRPPAEAMVPIKAEMRKAVIAEVGIANPTSRDVVFDVRTVGDGLIGESAVALGPHEARMYELVFAPLQSGRWEGSLAFHSDEVGEYWYRLELEGLEPEPVVLGDLWCDIGKTAQVQVTLQNPIGQDLQISIANSNPVNFDVSPSPLLLRAYGDAQATITYMPSAIDQLQSASIAFVSRDVGRWQFVANGYGRPPSAMTETVVSAAIHSATMANVTFRNPYPRTMRCSIRLEPEALDGAEFTLQLKRGTTAIGPFAVLQIPFSYAPTVIAEHRVTLVVELLGQPEPMEFEFPVVGVAEATQSRAAVKFKCRAREEHTQIIALPLDQLDQPLASEKFTHEVVIPKEALYRSAVQRAITVEMVDFPRYADYVLLQRHVEHIHTDDPDPAMAQNHLFFSVQFMPLRPFSEVVTLVTKKASGGMWRWDLQLDALPSAVDDVIHIEAELGKTESVAFHLTNLFSTNDPFTAYFSTESPSDFTVMPTKGILMGAPNVRSTRSTPSNAVKGSQFVVSFSSKGYGKALTGFLVIDTQEMQWRYEVHGSLPKYNAPAGQSKVDRQLAPTTQERLRAMQLMRQKRNFMKENQSVLSQASLTNKVARDKDGDKQRSPSPNPGPPAPPPQSEL